MLAEKLDFLKAKLSLGKILGRIFQDEKINMVLDSY